MNEHQIILNANEAAEIAGIPPALLKLWLATGKFVPSESPITSLAFVGTKTNHYFNEADIQRLMKLAKSEKPKPAQSDFEDDGIQENFTVGEIASLWRLSRDTVQRMFQDEPGVMPLGNPNPRGKRKRITLRIPRAVMERVKKRRSNA